MSSLAGHWLQEGIQQGLDQGMVKGFEQGAEEGERRGVEKVAVKMLRLGKPINEIVEVTGITIQRAGVLAAEITQKY